jgi:hypothetical protein
MANIVGLPKRKNLIIGGDFTTNPWQRGTSSTPTNGLWYADRWLTLASAAGFTISKSQDVPTVVQCNLYAEYSAMLDCVSTMTGTSSYSWQQTVEGYEIVRVIGKPVVLSFWVKSNKTGTFSVVLKSGGTSEVSNVNEYTIDAADTWEKKIIRIDPLPTTPANWVADTGVGLRVWFPWKAGNPTYGTTSLGQWLSGNYQHSSNSANMLDSTSNYVKLALIQLEEGTEATDFEYRSYQEELRLCQRYFCKTFPPATAPATGQGTNGSLYIFNDNNSLSFTTCAEWRYPVPMRSVPTVTTYPTSAGTNGWTNGSTGTELARTIFAGSQEHCVIANAAGMAGQTQYNIHATAQSEI